MARLHRSDITAPGYRRVRGSRIVDGTGHAVPAEDLARIRALVIPPAWRDVWICADPHGHIQAVGIDAAGRKQYLYHAAWRERRDRAKFDRALQLAASIGPARGTATRDLGGGSSKRRMLAAAFRTVDLGSLRIGSEQYLEAHGSRGLTTLQCGQATVNGSLITLNFRSKSGQRWHSDIEDPELAAVLAKVVAVRGARARLFSWRDTRWHRLHPVDVNDYIRQLTGGDFTAKDFRTLRGTLVAAGELARTGPAPDERSRRQAIASAIAVTAHTLGNTPAVARASYVDPRVLDRYARGKVIGLTRGRATERGLVTLLGAEGPGMHRN
jgi:DNA topoisomerase-1